LESISNLKHEGIEEGLERRREDRKKRRQRRIGRRTMNVIKWLGKGEGYKGSEGGTEIDEVECGQKEGN
jgi:hypothetical protein